MDGNSLPQLASLPQMPRFVAVTCGLLELRSGYRCDLRQFLNVSEDLKLSKTLVRSKDSRQSILKGFALIFMGGHKQLILNQFVVADVLCFSGRIRFGFPSSPAKTIRNLNGTSPKFFPLCQVFTTSKNPLPA